MEASKSPTENGMNEGIRMRNENELQGRKLPSLLRNPRAGGLVALVTA